MKVIFLTAGSGNAFYCENCLRDAAIVQGLHRFGQDVMTVPLYLPGPEQLMSTPGIAPIFMGGINIFLQQKSGLFRKIPPWLDRWLDNPALLRWIGRRAGMTDPGELAQTTLSMLAGRNGHQHKELNRLITWLKTVPRADIFCLSNLLLAGIVPALKESFSVPVISLLQDEDEFIDSLPSSFQNKVWFSLAQKAQNMDLLLASSEYYKNAMQEKLGPAAKISVFRPGLETSFYQLAESVQPPRLGFLSRLCPANGADLVIGAFARLARKHDKLELHLAGGNTGADHEYISQLNMQIRAAGLEQRVHFHPALNLEDRIAFLRSLSILCVPQQRKSAYALYLLEALACGVPAVVSDHGAAGEWAKLLGSGIFPVTDPTAHNLSAVIDNCLHNLSIRESARAGRRYLQKQYDIAITSHEMLSILEKIHADFT